MSLHDKRVKLINDARDILARAEKEARGLNTEEKASYEAMWSEADSIKDLIERKEASDAEARALDKIERITSVQSTGSKSESDEERRASAHLAAYRAYLRGDPVDRRDMEAGTFSKGGALVVPTAVVAGLLTKVRARVMVRQFATVYQVRGAAALGIPTIESDMSDPEWTTEVPSSEPTADSALEFGSRELKPKPLVKLAKLSRTLIRLAVNANPEDIANEELSAKFAAAQENAYINGDGVKGALGLLPGLSTDRDVLTGAADKMTFDGLIDAVESVDEYYHASCRWLLPAAGMANLRKLKDKNDQYLWQPSNQAGVPDRLLGFPFHRSKFLPTSITTGKRIGIFGDFSKYVIADSLEMTIQQLNELYATKRQTGYLAEMETDGQPVLAEAFAVIKTS